MTFLNPMFLFALAAAGIPVAIHFLGKRRPRRVAFSAMVFLEEVRRQQFRRLKFRNALLLLLRTATIVCVVLAFARPTIKTNAGAFGHEGASAIVVVLDDGPGMGYESSYGRRIDWARRQLSDMLSVVRPGDWAVLIRTSRPDLVLPFTRATLENLKSVSDWSGDGVAALQHAADILGRSDAANREVYVVSDLAGPPWQSLRPVQWPDRTAGYLLAPADEPATNLAVDSVAAGNQFVRAGRPFSVRAIVRNTGTVDVNDASADLWFDNRRMQRQVVSVPAGGVAAVTFSAVVPAPGWLTGRIELSDDPLIADNTRHFAVFVPAETRLAIIGDESPSRAFLSALFTAADSTNPYSVAVGTERTIPRDSVEQADVIIVNERVPTGGNVPGWISEATHRASAQSTARDGAGILFLTGPGTDLTAANQSLLPLFTGDRFAGLSTLSAGTGGYYSLDSRSVSDPVLTSLLSSSARASQPRFFTFARLTGGTAHRVVSFTTGDPWLVRGEKEPARGMVLTTGLSPEWGDLAYRGVVVPLMHHLVHSLARTSPVAGEYPAGTSVRRPLVTAGETIMLTAPDGLQRRVVPAGDEIPSLDLGMLTPRGCWSISADGNVTDMIAVNLHRDESELQRLSSGAFAGAVGLRSLTRLGARPADDIVSARIGTELAVPFFLAAMACIAAELLLMRGIAMGKRDAEAAAPPSV